MNFGMTIHTRSAIRTLMPVGRRSVVKLITDTRTTPRCVPKRRSCLPTTPHPPVCTTRRRSPTWLRMKTRGKPCTLMPDMSARTMRSGNVEWPLSYVKRTQESSADRNPKGQQQDKVQSAQPCGACLWLHGTEYARAVRPHGRDKPSESQYRTDEPNVQYLPLLSDCQVSWRLAGYLWGIVMP